MSGKGLIQEVPWRTYSMHTPFFVDKRDNQDQTHAAPQCSPAITRRSQTDAPRVLGEPGLRLVHGKQGRRRRARPVRGVSAGTPYSGGRSDPSYGSSKWFLFKTPIVDASLT